MSDGTVYVNFKSRIDYATVIFGSGVFINEIKEYCKYVDWFVWLERRQYRIDGKTDEIKMKRLNAFVQHILLFYNYEVKIRDGRNDEWEDFKVTHISEEKIIEIECELNDEKSFYANREKRLGELKIAIPKEESVKEIFEKNIAEGKDVELSKRFVKESTDKIEEYKKEYESLTTDSDIKERHIAVRNIFRERKEYENE